MSIIFLSDFYSNDIYKFDLETKEAKVMQKELIDKDLKINGFYCEEKCGLFKKQLFRYALYLIQNKFFFSINKSIIEIDKTFQIKRNVFFPLIIITTIKSKSFTYKCYQWSRDIDEFLMDDFYYFLNYSFLKRFENLKEYT